MAKRNYALSVGRTLFVDDETGLKVLPNMVVTLDKDRSGFRTKQAIMHGHLTESSEKKSSNNAKDESDLPDDLPGRDAFVAAEIDFAKLQGMSKKDLDAVKGIGPKTLEELETYLA